jgi:hypothetical protein
VGLSRWNIRTHGHDLPIMRSLELAVRMQSCVALIWNAYLHLCLYLPI